MGYYSVPCKCRLCEGPVTTVNVAVNSAWMLGLQLFCDKCNQGFCMEFELAVLVAWCREEDKEVTQ